MVTAAGNTWTSGVMKPLPDTLMYPARFDRVIAATGVTATQTPYRNEFNEGEDIVSRDKGSPNMGSCAGPASAMKTAIAGYTPNVAWAGTWNGKDENFFTRKGGGTSSATPQIAAAAALYIHKYKTELDKIAPKNIPGTSWKRAEIVRQALFISAKKSKTKLYNSYFGKGRLKAMKALKLTPQLAWEGAEKQMPRN